jgi:2-beta-glucuronyltransferase
MTRIVLLSGHFPHQPRRPSLLWVSQALQDTGWHVTHATVGYSWLSLARRDPRLTCLPTAPQTGHHDLTPQLSTLYHHAPIHPFSTKNPWLDTALRPLHGLFQTYWAPRLRAPLSRADIVLIESGPPVMLARCARRLAPQATLIYRVNDDIRLLNAPAFLQQRERHSARLFDRISTASPELAARFADHPNVTLDPMGIPQARLACPGPDPYTPRARSEAVCAGTTQLDLPALIRIARARPLWRLHVLGRLKHPAPDLPNLLFHGEQDFATTLAHIAHADIGLAPYLDRPGVEYQRSNSNRMLLYRHFGLPILGPDRLCHPGLPAIIGYANANWVQLCESWTKTPEAIPDWSDLARRLVQNPVTDPPVDVAMSPATA